MGSGATKFDEIHAPSCQILFPMLAHQPPDNVAASTAFPGTNTQGGGAKDDGLSGTTGRQLRPPVFKVRSSWKVS